MRPIFRRSSEFFVLGALLLGGCSLGLDFDRSKIKHGDTDASTEDAGKGSGGTGGGKKDAGSDAATAMDASKDSGDDSGSGNDSGTGTECTTAATCPGTDSACHKRTCIGGVCGAQDVAKGNTALSGQTAGDCKRVVCDGKGHASEIADDSDGPSDGKQCTMDTCASGAAKHDPEVLGTSCTESNGNVCDGAGKCVECNVPADCPDQDNDCQTITCDSVLHTCGKTFVNAGVAVPAGSQVAGDCKEIQCNGAGGTTTVNKDTDKPNDDGNQCTNETCSVGVPMHPSLTDGVSCSQNGGHFCRSGLCKECAVANNCPGSDTECHVRACNTGVCGTTAINIGNALSTGQTANDCKELRCDNAGNSGSVNDPNDPPADDGNQCTDEICVAGNGTHPKTVSGTGCSQNGGSYCDGNGSCVECLFDSHCNPQICIANTCEPQGTLTSVTLSPASLAAGATGNVTVSFTTADRWSANGVLSVVFPSGFNVSGAGFVSFGNAAGSATVAVVGQQVLVTRTSGGTVVAAGSALSVTLSGIKNPTTSGTTGSATVSTTTAQNVPIDTGTSAGVAITPGVISGASVTLSPSTPNATPVAVTIVFTTSNPWPRDGDLVVDFPSGFDVSAATFSGLTGVNGNAAITAQTSTSLTITRDDMGTEVGPGPLTLMIDNVTNPGAGMTSAYTLTTHTAASVAIDTGTAAGSNVQ